MSTQREALCTVHKSTNGRHYCEFAVDDTESFAVQPSPLEYERLVEQSVPADDTDTSIGWVPIVDDDGWAIDWDGLDGYTRS
jgi:hypothetical protein